MKLTVIEQKLMKLVLLQDSLEEYLNERKNSKEHDIHRVDSNDNEENESR